MGLSTFSVNSRFMIYLLLTILANVLIFLAFRSFSRFRVNTFPAIVTNYLVCVITGTLYAGSQVYEEMEVSSPWFYSAIFMGVVFVSTFYLMARTTQLRGVAVATVASKMSLAVPVLFSLFVFKIGTNSLDFWNYLGIGTAFIAILLVSKKPAQHATEPLTIRYIALPFAVFLMGGLIDTSLNFINHKWITPQIEALFPILVFGFAFVIGSVIIVARRIRVKVKDIVAGTLLGIPNYFSIYLQLKALNAFDNNGAILYPSLNIGIIIGSTLLAIIFFKEHLKAWNWVGIVLAMAAILLLSHQELLKNLNLT